MSLELYLTPYPKSTWNNQRPISKSQYYNISKKKKKRLKKSIHNIRLGKYFLEGTQKHNKNCKLDKF